MRKSTLMLITLLSANAAQAAFFVDASSLRELMAEYGYYQEGRQIRYMAKASQYVGYVTGIVDALDGTKFCLPGGVTAEQAAAKVAAYLNAMPDKLTRRASDSVAAALAANFPCKP